MRIVIFGANGPTGRLLTRLSLTAGYDTVAVTRQPGAFGMRDPRLRVAGADVLDADAVDGVVKGSDAVLSALGVPFGKTLVEVCSRGAEHMLDAMKRHDVRRLVVVSSGAVTGEDEPTGGFWFNRVLQPYVTKRLGKTVYDDMRRMEDLVSRSDADWTMDDAARSLRKVIGKDSTHERAADLGGHGHPGRVRRPASAELGRRARAVRAAGRCPTTTTTGAACAGPGCSPGSARRSGSACPRSSVTWAGPAT